MKIRLLDALLPSPPCYIAEAPPLHLLQCPLRSRGLRQPLRHNARYRLRGQRALGTEDWNSQTSPVLASSVCGGTGGKRTGKFHIRNSVHPHVLSCGVFLEVCAIVLGIQLYR